MASSIPLPVSALLRRALKAKSAKDRHDTAYFAWEASVVLAVAARPPSDLAALTRPSVGSWVAAVQASEERLADPALVAALVLFTEGGTGRKVAPKKASAREVLDALPAYRNQLIGHGSTRGSEFYEDAGHVLVEGLEAAWRSGCFLRDEDQLTYVEAVDIDPTGRRRARLLDLMGDVGRVVDARGTPDVPPDVLPRRVYLRSGSRFRALHPWVLYQEEETRERLWLFASLHHRPRWLDYVAGETLTGDALKDAFPGAEADAYALFEQPSPASAAPDGERIGDWRILGRLGSGGMGTVYRARREGTASAGGLPPGTEVALKVVHPHLLETEGFFKRFQREAEIGRRIVHENVVRTFDVESVRQDGRDYHFLVMEYVQGQTLRALLADLGRLPEELCRHIGREVAKALTAIHAGGVVHRDVKPENVLITGDNVVKVMDLGVARSAEDRLRISGTGAFVGSVQYAAPEQFSDGDPIDGRTDLYSLGVTLYELSTGQNPYVGEEVHKTLRRVLEESPRRCSELNPQLSPFFEELVHALLAKRMADRVASAAALVRILDEGERSDWWVSRAKAIRAETKRPLRRIRIPRETALYGRDGEIARLRALWGKAKAGEGKVVLVEGEAGIGKSRLVDEFVGLLQREGEDLNFLHGSYPPGGAATVSGAFSTAYREQFGVEGLEDTLKSYIRETPALVPAFAALLRGEGVPTGAEGLTKDSLQTVFVNSTRALAAERPTVLLIDDLHFAPEEGRSLFAALAMAVPGHRVLLFGTTRPGLDERWLAHFDRIGATRLSLSRLGPKDLSRLLVDALRSEHLAVELAYRIGAKSDGNPFFVFEILRGLRETQLLSQGPDGTWTPTQQIADIQIPSSILELVQARVADLDEAEKNLLDVAACVGFEFDPLLVAEVMGLAKIPAMQAFAKVEKRHRLVRSAGRSFVFDQHQVQEACYFGLPEILREEYHGAIADALEARHAADARGTRPVDGALAADLAENLFKANRPDRALAYLDAALAYLERKYLNDAAVRLEGRALAAPGLVEGKARAELLLRHARRLDLVGRPSDEVRCLEEARTLADESRDPTLRARARNELGDLFRRIARYDEARAALEESLAIYREVGLREGEAVVTMNLGVLAWVLGRYAEAREHHERGLAIAREIGNRRSEEAATHNLAIVLASLGRHEESRGQYERALALAREIGDRAEEADVSANLGLLCESQGLLDEARTCFERALEVSRGVGRRRGEAHATACLGGILRSLGRTEEAVAHFERYLALSRDVGDRVGEATGVLNLGLLLCDQGRHADARARMEQALGAFREIRFRWGEAQALLLTGCTLVEEGRPAEAAARLAEAVSAAREISLPGVRYVASAELATLPRDVAGDATPAALMAMAECEAASDVGDVMRARLCLWRATGDPAHLVEAKARLDRLLGRVPPDSRAAMVANVRLHREIAEASARAGL